MRGRDETERGGGAPPEDADRASEDISPWEWLLAGLGALLVTGALGFLLRQGLVDSEEPGAVIFTVKAIATLENGFLVQFEASNRGSTTLADLLVEGELRQGERLVETSEARLDYLPARSSREGGLFYARDPRTHALELRARGYQRP